MIEQSISLLPPIACAGAPTLDVVHHMDALELCASLPPQSVDAIICDPPYGSTACAWDVRVPFEPMWAAFKRVIKPRGAIVMTAAQPFTSLLVCSNLKMFKYSWVWCKSNASNFLNASRQPMAEHEDVLVFCDGIAPYYPQLIERKDKNRVLYPYKPSKNIKTESYGNFDFPIRVAKDINLRAPSSVLPFISERGLHVNQKPVALFDYLIRTYTQPGDVVLDPFCGSGTTGVAARQTGRHYILGDSSAEYVEVAKKRLAQPFTPPLFTDAPKDDAPAPMTLPMFDTLNEVQTLPVM